MTPSIILLLSFLIALATAWSLIAYLWWQLAAERGEKVALRVENERLLARIGYEYGLHLGRQPYVHPSYPPPADISDLTPPAPYFQMKQRY